LKTKKSAFAIAAVIVVFVLVLAVTELYFASTQPKPAVNPFRFCLTANPTSATIIQGGNTTLTLEATYQSGDAESITFSALGGPNGTQYLFSSQNGTVTNNHPFKSNLTISVPATADSEVYAIQISAAPQKSAGNQASFNLSVVNSQITVSGTITGTSLAIAGYSSEDIFPTNIAFTSITTGESYEVHVKRYGDTEQYPGKVGNYTITLPNLQSYKVQGYFFSLPHYIPVLRVAQGDAQKGVFMLNCIVGVSSAEANFWG
jgi:hypothetical protein